MERARLSAARHRMGWSQEALAERVGVSRRTISQWERGEATPFPLHVHKLCAVFDTTADVLDLEEKQQELTTIAETTAHSNTRTTSDSFSQELSNRLLLTLTELQGQDMDAIRRRLLQFLLGITGEMLVSPSHASLNAETLERLSRVLQKPNSIDKDILTSLEVVTIQKRHRFVSSEGASWRELMREVSGHLDVIARLLEIPQPAATYTTLCTLAGETALLLGDILFNAGDNKTADTYYDVSLTAAKEANHNVLQAVVLGRKSFIPIYGNAPQNALPYLEEAQNLTTHNTADIISSWLWAIKGEAYAKMHDAVACLHALTQAENLLTRDHPGNISYAFMDSVAHALMNPLKLLGYKGTCYIYCERSEDAQTVLRTYLDVIHSANSMTTLQHKSIILADLSMAHSQQGDVSTACEWAKEALNCITQTGSARVFQRVLNVRRALLPWKQTTYIQDLDEHIVTVLPAITQ